MSTPENAHHSSHPAGSKPLFLYKCLLHELARKFRKPLPIYQTTNEGSDHLPRFRSTVFLDDLNYTSSSTFQQRMMAEMDASRVAYIALTQKAKTESLNLIREDKTYCKSVIAEFAAKKKLRNPVYKTTQLKALPPVFRSHLLFNGVTYPGENGRSKKEAEQLVACSVIIQYLDSEAGDDLATIVNSKLRQYHEIKNVPNGSNVLTMANSSATLESSSSQGTMVPAQPILPHVSVEPITPVCAPVGIQPPTPEQSSTAPVVTESSVSQVAVEPIKPVAEPLVFTPIPSVLVNNPRTPVEVPANNLSAQALEYIPLVDETSENARKKRRLDDQMPSQVLPFSTNE